MILEIFRITFLLESTVIKVEGLSITKNNCNDRSMPTFEVNMNLPESSAKEKIKKFVWDKWSTTQCSLLKYKKFEINRLPKDLKWFSRLVFHNFNYFTSNISNQSDVRNKIESFLDFTGGSNI